MNCIRAFTIYYSFHVNIVPATGILGDVWNEIISGFSHSILISLNMVTTTEVKGDLWIEVFSWISHSIFVSLTWHQQWDGLWSEKELCFSNSIFVPVNMISIRGVPADLK